MNIVTFKDNEELSRKTAEFIADFVNKKPDALLCFPAGHTSLGTFKDLVKFSQEGRINFDRCSFVGLDEWAGLEDGEPNCRDFMYTNLFNDLKLNPNQIVFFDGNSADLEAECKSIDIFIMENGPVDLMLLGVGMNGHLGLNEPGVSHDNYSFVVELDSVTKSIGQKYFDKPMKLEKGITLGLKHIMEAKTVVLQVSGNKKAEIVKKLIEGEVSMEVPASILKIHSGASIFMDRDAASML